MSPFDISVLLFFAVAALKAICDTFDFWREFEEDAAVAAPSISPKHLPAPSRPSPKQITPARSMNATRQPARIEPIRRQQTRRTVRPATVASAERSIKPVNAPIKKTAATRKTTVA